MSEEKEKHSCSVCKEDFSSFHALNIHTSIKHSQKTSSYSKNIKTEQSIPICECKRSFRTNSALISHQKVCFKQSKRSASLYEKKEVKISKLDLSTFSSSKSSSSTPLLIMEVSSNEVTESDNNNISEDVNFITNPYIDKCVILLTIVISRNIQLMN